MQSAGSRGNGVGVSATCDYGPQTDVTRDDHGSPAIHRLQGIAGNPCETLTLASRELAEAGRASTGDSVSWLLLDQIPHRIVLPWRSRVRETGHLCDNQ